MLGALTVLLVFQLIGEVLVHFGRPADSRAGVRFAAFVAMDLKEQTR